MQKFFLLFFLLCVSSLDAITLVYNMKIRRAFEIPAAVQEQQRSIWIATLLPIVYKRDRHIVSEVFQTDVTDKRLSGGMLINLRYIPKRAWWFEFTTGIEKERASIKGTSNFKTSRTGFDDIIITGGHNFFPMEHMQFVIYGLAGFPTKWNVTAQEAQDTLVGTRFFGAAVGWELSYSFIHEPKRALTGILQNRFLHFFNRSWTPILPEGSKIQPGNVTDVLLTMQYREKTNIFELGYNPTIFTNQAVLLPTGPIKSETAVRNSIYLSASHIWREASIINTPFLFGIGTNIGWASRYKTRIFSWWFNLSTLF